MMMHFSIPDVQEINDGNGSTFIGYNIHVNGIFHCTVRYKQLHNLNEQLRKEFGSEKIHSFPPKKLLPLTESQVEERRVALEKYIQLVGQEPKIFNSDLMVGFLSSAQQETTCEKNDEINLDVYLMNNSKVTVRVLMFDRTEQVLIKVCREINLPPEYVKYFSLFLVNDDRNVFFVIRKLLHLESPYMTQRLVKEKNKIFLRKSYWDINFDTYLLNDPVSLNLLYVQTVTELEKGWIICTKDTRHILTNLQAKLAKKDYIVLAATLKYYGYMQFAPCYCDYPKIRTKVLIAIGEHELNMRVIDSSQIVREGSFKVMRMKCWRITAIHNKQDYPTNSSSNNPNLELSFEYLMSKDKLQWITITSEQAILMSVCLQSLVDELLVKKNGAVLKHSPSNKFWSYMKRDGSNQLISINNVNSSTNSTESNNVEEPFSVKKLQEKFSVVTFKNGKEFVENHAFEDIGDDDL